MPAYVDTMAYRGETPWHGIGARIDGEWIESIKLAEAAKLAWEAVKTPAYYMQDNGIPAEIPGVYTIVRSDTGQSLGCAVGARYEPFQNSQLIALGDALCATGEARWETAGSLKGGRTVWGLAQVVGAIDVKRRDGTLDRSVPYLLIHNTHDGTGRLRASFTSTRVVCANTLGWAVGALRAAQRAASERGESLFGEDADVLAREFVSRHTAGIHDRAEEARQALGIAMEAQREHADTYQALADTPMDRASFTTFCAQLLSGQDDPEAAVEHCAKVGEAGGRSAANLDRKGSELQRLFEDARRGNRGEDRFDAINAVTDWIDHQRNRLAVHRRLADRLGVAEHAFQSAQFGHGASVKRRALKLLAR